MKILLVNDDGFGAPGIITLEKLLSRLGEVFVVAPKEHMSGKSMSTTILKPFFVKKIDEHHHIVDATPVDATSYGVLALKEKFDIVFSGINSGPNLSYDTLYSGTIGAALQANLYGVPSIAFSCFNNFDIVTKYFDEVMQFIDDHHLIAPHRTISVNFPRGESIKGIVFAKPSMRKDELFLHHDDEEVHFSRKVHIPKDEESDEKKIMEGYITITIFNPCYHVEEDMNCMM